MPRKSILDIREGQNQVKVIQTHQVHLFLENVFLSSHEQKKLAWFPGAIINCEEFVPTGQNQVKVIQCHQVKFFRKYICGVPSAERYFRHHRRSKSAFNYH